MPTTFANAAEMQERLGGIPRERIRMTPSPGTATVEDLVECQAESEFVLELVDGTVVEKATETWSGLLGGLGAYFVNQFLEEHDLGLAFSGKGPHRLGVDLVRCPSVSFVSWDQFPGDSLPDEEVWRVHPDLAIEVVARSTLPREMNRRVRDYLHAGSKLVWLIDRITRTATIHRPAGEPQTIDENGTLDGADVLPGFALRLGDIFDRATRGRKR